MLRATLVGGSLFIAVVAVMGGCEGVEDQTVDREASPVIGVGGASIIDAPGVRAYTAQSGQHTAVFRQNSTSDLLKATGTPFAAPVGIAGALTPRSSPWGYRRHDGKEAILYVDSVQHVHEVTIANGNFDLFTTFGLDAPNAAASSSGFNAPDVIGYVRSDNRSAIVYRSSNNHVIELRSNFGSQPAWMVTDLTVASNALVTASQGSAFPYVRTDNWNTIVYLASDDHIHELASTGNGAWIDSDLFAAAGAVGAGGAGGAGGSSGAGGATVVPTTEPWGYRRSDGYNSVIFVDSLSRIRELALFPGAGGWGLHTLPGTLARRGADTYGRPAGYVRADSLSAVVYVGTDGAVHELALTGAGWIDSTLPTPGVTIRGQVFAHRAPGDRSSVLFQGSTMSGTQRYELSLPLGGQWGLQAF